MGCVELGHGNGQNQGDSTTGSSPRNQNVDQLKISEGLFVQENSGSPYDHYDKVITMGEGSFGRVIKVKSKKGNIYRAMKIINKEKLKLKKEEEEKLIKEINILKALDHPNIMKVYEYYNSPKELDIITELCTGGELFNKIVKVRKFSEAIAAHIMKQLLSVVECCHLQGIIHRDLKPENILIETEEQAKKDYFNIKVIDFGTGEVLANGAKCVQKIGTPFYIAPEILSDRPYDSKCDLWSCGVILYILLSGVQPFNGSSDGELFNNIKTKPVSFSKPEWRRISDNAKDLIRNLLEKNPNKRFNARKALDHPWIILNTKKDVTNISKAEIQRVVENLKNFKANHKLQQAALAYIVHNLLDNDKEVVTLKEIFKKFDLDNDGRLTKLELFKGLCQSMTKEEAEKETERVMEIIDADGNGSIEFEEFIRAGIDKKKILTKENLLTVFRVFDIDKSGKISPSEIKNILDREGNFDEEVWNQLIKEIDLNGDGEISFSEFQKMMSLLLK